MTRYAALLRGVNVGGINLKMADVKAVFEGLGLGGVKTVLASGNVLFETDLSADEVQPLIERALGERFGYEAWVQVHGIDAIRALLTGFPFDAERDGWHPYVVFVADPAVAGELLAMQDELDPVREQILAGPGVVYWTVERGSTLTSAFGKALGRARYKAATTTRNLRTLQKLVA
ncbi:DUF1697 domain-containing protein [Cryobacterium tepidiphilum]|uniref:DUF1697 domain-containing protein n=1 Tax=Cryobacterium tepidiphilum TaxID=2486026 RepID=A0A3M8LRJ1_9MICO|nr:DUF1697 domain-containing protein [Cryobacterium tepidiphilum]RNE67364.1 DUF1697 domain-containing protein [Cryobacterium tepidiphilum]